MKARKQSRSVLRRQQNLISTAKELSLKYGPEYPTAKMIADKSGSGRSTFYEYYDSIEELKKGIYLEKKNKLIYAFESKRGTLHGPNDERILFDVFIDHWKEYLYCYEYEMWMRRRGDCQSLENYFKYQLGENKSLVIEITFSMAYTFCKGKLDPNHVIDMGYYYSIIDGINVK